VGHNQEASQLFASCLDTGGVCLALVAGRQVALASGALHRLLGYPPGAMDGLPWEKLIAPARHLTFERISRVVAEHPESPVSYEVGIQDAAGTVVIQEVTQRQLQAPGFEGQLLVFAAPRRDRPLESAEYLTAVCSQCGNVRDDSSGERGQGEWLPMLDYVSSHELGRITHSLCPECAAWLLMSR
jgi:hypothetical protein